MNNNKKILIDFLDKERVSASEFAGLVKAITCRPCSERTVQSWLSSSDVVSSRPCPDWLIDLLPKIKKEIKK